MATETDQLTFFLGVAGGVASVLLLAPIVVLIGIGEVVANQFGRSFLNRLPVRWRDNPGLRGSLLVWKLIGELVLFLAIVLAVLLVFGGIMTVLFG